MTLEYVASGTSYIRLGYPAVKEQHNIAFYRKVFSYLNGRNGHEFSLLYNAWTETGLVPNIMMMRDSFENLYADSGGLQIITQGKSITEQMKLGVYKNQAQFSDFGMCFDEIPLQFTGKQSSRTDFSNRFFDKEMLDLRAAETGQNVLKQIHTYMEEKSKSKPVIILQGNCYESFMRWLEVILKQIPQEERKYLGPIAMSGASIGTGLLQDIERAYIFSQLDYDCKHLHLLGLGSISRFLPFAIFHHNGMFKEDLKISYDSTTHTSAPHMGRYYKDGTNIDFSRPFDNRYNIIYNDIQSKFDMGMSIEEYHIAMNVPATKMKDISHTFRAFSSHIVATIDNFTHEVNKVWSDKSYMEYMIKDNVNLHHLANCATREEVNSWFTHVSPHVKTAKIANVKPVNAVDLGFIE